MSAPKVILYSSPWCGFCARARSLLDDKGIVYEEIDVEAVDGAREEMLARSGRRTVPQIFIGASHVGGCEELQALDASGRLDSMLNNRS